MKAEDKNTFTNVANQASPESKAAIKNGIWSPYKNALYQKVKGEKRTAMPMNSQSFEDQKKRDKDASSILDGPKLEQDQKSKRSSPVEVQRRNEPP